MTRYVVHNITGHSRFCPLAQTASGQSRTRDSRASTKAESSVTGTSNNGASSRLRAAGLCQTAGRAFAAATEPIFPCVTIGFVSISLLCVLIAHTVGLFAQAALAGEFLSGTDAVVKFHEWTSWIVLAVCATQIAMAALALRSGVASLWLLIGSVLIFLAEVLQVGTGYARFLRVHLPLGVVVSAAVSWQMISQFRRSSGSKQ